MARTAKQRAALRKAQLASARARRKRGGVAGALDRNTKRRRARVSALKGGKGVRQTRREVIRSGAVSGATYGGAIGGVKGAAAGAAIGAAVGAAVSAKRKVHRVRKPVRARKPGTQS